MITLVQYLLGVHTEILGAYVFSLGESRSDSVVPSPQISRFKQTTVVVLVAISYSNNTRTLYIQLHFLFTNQVKSSQVAFQCRDGNGSVGHGSNGSPLLDGSRGPLTHDEITQYHYQATYFCFPLRLATI